MALNLKTAFKNNSPGKYWLREFMKRNKLTLNSESHLPKKFVLLAWLKALKNDEKCFLFPLKSSFRSQDI